MHTRMLQGFQAVRTLTVLPFQIMLTKWRVWACDGMIGMIVVLGIVYALGVVPDVIILCPKAVVYACM